MRNLLRETADLAADFLESLPERPVWPHVEVDDLRARLGGALPDGPTDPAEVVRDLAAIGSEAWRLVPTNRMRPPLASQALTTPFAAVAPLRVRPFSTKNGTASW